jgi:hypothetical protein
MRVQTFLRKKGIEIERRHSGNRSIIFRKIEMHQMNGRPTCRDNRSFFMKSREEHSDPNRESLPELIDRPESKINGDYENTPIKIIERTPYRQQGSM